MGINIVALSGHVGVDPVIYTKEDFKIAKISMSTVGYRNRKEVVDWHNVDAYGQVAEFVEKHVKKGDYVSLTGYLSTTSYKGSDGKDKKSYSVKVVSLDKPNVKKIPVDQSKLNEYERNKEKQRREIPDDPIPY